MSKIGIVFQIIDPDRIFYRDFLISGGSKGDKGIRGTLLLNIKSTT